MLMVWDNYESVLPQFNDGAAQQGSPYTDAVRGDLADLFRDLTTGPGNGCVLVTCRPGETRLPRAMKFGLQGLARADSLWLLHRILEREHMVFAHVFAEHARIRAVEARVRMAPAQNAFGTYGRAIAPDAYPRLLHCGAHVFFFHGEVHHAHAAIFFA